MWDAFLLNRPVVATKVGDVPQLVSNGVHAILVPPDDAVALSEAILSVVENTQNTRQMVDQANQMVKNRLMNDASEGFIKAIRHVLNSSHQS